MIAKEEKVKLRGANGSPKTILFWECQHRLGQSTCLAKAGRRSAESAGSGRTPDPLIAKRKE